MPKTMWAQTLTAPFRFEREEVPAPTAADLAPGQVLLRLLAAGVCGSDLPFFKGTPTPRASLEDGRLRNPPGAPVHEVAGEVLASADHGLEPGERVVGWASGANGLAEYVITNATDVVRYDERLKPEQAILLQPLACVLHAVGELGPLEGVRAAVIGQGPIGLLFSHTLKSAGAARVTGVDRVDRSDVAADFGVDECVLATSGAWAVQYATNGWAIQATAESDAPGLIVEAVGHQTQTLTDAANALAMGGHLYYFGIPDDHVYPFPMATFLRKNARMTTGVTPADRKRSSLARADRYVASHPGLADRYVTHVLSVNEATKAFRMATDPRPGQVKVVVTAQA